MRRALGAVVFLVGVATTVFAGYQLVSNGGGAVAVASPTPGAGPTSSAAPASVGPPTSPSGPTPRPTSPSDPLVYAFVLDLAHQISAATQVSLVNALDPAVLARYGLETCRADLASIPADPAFAVAVQTIASPAPWDYVTDARTTTIPDAIAVGAIVTSRGAAGASPASEARTLHFHIVDGGVRWFTDCGAPLP